MQSLLQNARIMLSVKPLVQSKGTFSFDPGSQQGFAYLLQVRRATASSSRDLLYPSNLQGFLEGCAEATIRIAFKMQICTCRQLTAFAMRQSLSLAGDPFNSMLFKYYILARIDQPFEGPDVGMHEHVLDVGDFVAALTSREYRSLDEEIIQGTRTLFETLGGCGCLPPLSLQLASISACIHKDKTAWPYASMKY